jgi:hypothetical protein
LNCYFVAEQGNTEKEEEEEENRKDEDAALNDVCCGVWKQEIFL